jgi:Tfp pilus assembly PilM family ATPase/Tfp pilus assembly protein PilN
MIYLKTGVGIELHGEDLLIASLQGNFSAEAFTHFTRIQGYRTRNKEDVRQEINLFFRSHGLSKERIVLGIPRRDIVLRYLDLPSEVADNLKQVVQYQVQSFEPTEGDRFYHDYALLHGNAAGKRLSVMLVMVRKAMLDDLLQHLLALGIRPVSVATGSIGLSNIFLQNQKDLQGKTFILGDLGASELEIIALRDGSIVFSREVPKVDETSWKDLILRETAEAASKIRLGPEGAVEKMALAGESSKSIYGEIKSEIPDCELIQNCIVLNVPDENKPHVQEAASTLGLAHMAMARNPSIKLNLLPPERRLHQSRWAYVPAAILGLAIVVLLCSFGFHRMAQDRILIRELDREILSLKAPVARVQSYRSQAEALEKKVKSVEDLLNNRDMNLDVLRELSMILPPDTFLNTYRNQDGTIQISGLSGSSSELIPTLSKSPCLKDVVQKGNIYKDPQTGKERFSFEAKLERCK